MRSSAEGFACPELAPTKVGSVLDRDERLAKRAVAGDRRAYGALFKRYHQPLYRYCRAILTKPEDAEDAVQATMVKALRALPGEEREIAIKPWLYRVAHNESVSILRGRRETVDLDAVAVGASPTVETTTEMRERIRTLVSDLATLPERQRATLVMRELNDLSYDEIAAVMGMGSAAARQAVYEARTALLEMADGREMECANVRQAISGYDRRVLRGRKIRAHLRGCDGCRNFDTAIAERRATLAALAPPLAAPAALALLHGVLGAGSAPTAGAGTVAGGVATGAAVKSAIAVLAAATVGGAAATGILDRDRDAGSQPATQPIDPSAEGSRGENGRESVTAPQYGRGVSASEPAVVREGRPDSAGEQGSGGATQAGNSAATPGHSTEAADQASSIENPVNPTADGGASATAPGQSETAPGQSETAPEQSETAPEQSETAPGQSGTAPGQSETAPGHSETAPGHSGTAPGQSGTAPGLSGTAPGQSGTAPGQSGTAPGQSGTAPGQSGTAPGQSGTGTESRGVAAGLPRPFPSLSLPPPRPRCQIVGFN